jgi:hypothetical protein
MSRVSLAFLPRTTPFTTASTSSKSRPCGTLWCTPKALWKLSWFLRDFGYDAELIDRDEIDEKRLVGLRGVVKVSHTTVNGRRFTNLEAFAPAETWDEVPVVLASAKPKGRRAAS